MLRRLARAAARAFVRPPPVRAVLRRATEASLLPRPVWQRLPVVEREIAVEFPDGGSFRYHVGTGSAFDRELFWRGLQSPEGVSLAAFYCLAKRADLVIDIGAHTGIYTLAALAAHSSSRVVAFEPVVENAAALADNLAKNGWSGRCEIQQLAIADRRGRTSLHVPTTPLPTSASLDPTGFRGLSGQVLHVEVTTLDEALRSGQRVDLVKIDVEGFEDKVLVGMERMLSSMRPVLMLECNPDGPVTRIQDLLISQNYVFRHVGVKGAQLSTTIRPDASERYRNFICVPE